MARNAAQDEEIGQRVDHIDRSQSSINADCESFAGELIDDVQHSILSPIMGAVLHEVIGPDVIGTLRP